MHKPEQEISKQLENAKTWQIMYKKGEPVIVTVVAVFNSKHDLRITDPSGKVFLFKYAKPMHHKAKQGIWCLGTLISFAAPQEVLIAKR